MNERQFYVTWRVSCERDTLMLARFRWYRFEIHWPAYDKMGRIDTWPVEVYNRDKYDSVWKFKSLSAATGWIIETCKDLALAEVTERQAV